MSLKNHPNKLILAFIITIAAILRFYHFFDLPFMWDELSALNRLHFSSISELIEKGVKPDGHPAGVQVFLYYWIQLFGNAEWVVKLPFNLMGLASIYIFYRITSIWFSEKSGLLAASFMASLQFFILYSPIARPYISGLFLSLLMVFYWSQYMFRVPARKYLVGFVLFAALSAYNHHFSLLFAAIVGFTGLFVIKKSQAKEYIISGIAIFALYLPHLPVFFHQLGIGGIGGEGRWLAEPSSYFILEFIEWSFQYSLLMMLMVFALLVFSIFFYQLKSKDKWIKSIILIIWFTLPLAIGYLYSTLINPVIQYSVFIFSFPYLIILISAGAGKLRNNIVFPLIIIIIGLNIYSLIVERQHFKIIFKQPFELTAQSTKAEINKNNSAFTIYNTIPSYQHYYFEKYGLDVNNSHSIYNKQYTLSELDHLLREINANTIISCGLAPEMVPLIQKHFPYFVQRTFAYTMDIYVFSKAKQDASLSPTSLLYQPILNMEKGWNIQSNRMKCDNSGREYYEFTSQQEWGFNFADSLKNIDIEPGAIIDIIAEVHASQTAINAIWAASFTGSSTEKIWRGKKLDLIPTETKDVYEVFFSLDTQILLETEDWNQQYFKTSLWNKELQPFNIYDIKVLKRAPNPIKYGLFQKLP